MKSAKASIKHLQIDKAKNSMFIVVAVCTVAIVFSLVSTKALLSQSSYQKKVLKERNNAVDQLKNNIKAAKTLKVQYDVFVKGNPNVIGGIGGEGAGTSPNASGQDGDNAKIVLDALPNQYDFPALISSIEKIASLHSVGIESINGTDTGGEGTSSDPSSAGSTQSSIPSNTTAPTGLNEGSQSQSGSIPINFSFSSKTTYTNSIALIKDFERSIRPFDITTFSLSGKPDEVSINIQANTYYQPSLKLEIGEKEVQK